MRLRSVLPALSLLLISCTAQLYGPSTAITSAFDGAGEIEAAGFVGTQGFDLQVAASPIDHLSIALLGSYAPESVNDTDYAHHHRYGELALGFYTPNIWPFGRNDGEFLQLALMGSAGIGESGSKWFLPTIATPIGPAPPPGEDITFYRMEGKYTRYAVRGLLCYEEPEFGAGMLMGAGWLIYDMRLMVDSLTPPAKLTRQADIILFGRYRFDAVELEAQVGSSTGGGMEGTRVDLNGVYLTLGSRLLLHKLFTGS